MVSKKVQLLLLIILIGSNIITVFAANTQQIRLTSTGSVSVSAPDPPTQPPSQTQTGQVLYTDGTRIMRNGQDYILYGMDVDHHPKMLTSSGSSANSPYETLFTSEDLDFYKENGFNLITLHLINLGEMIDGDGNINENFFENWVDIWVQWATEREIYCIIGMADLHVSSISYGVYTMPSWVSDDYGGSPSGSDWREEMRTIIHGFYGMDSRSDDERQVYYNLWKYIANRYKDNPYVMYGPTNEPMHHTWQDFDPGESYWHDLATAYSNTMATIVDYIREGEEGGYEKLVFIDRPYLKGGSFMSYLKPINKNNIVWEYHDYGGLSEWNTIGNWKIGVENQRNFFHAWNKPVHVGEWSVANTIDPEFWQIESAYSDQGGWKYYHLEQCKWMSQMDISHSWFHYARTAGEYWNVIMLNNGKHALSQSDSDYIFQTLFDYSR
jgi:hypothetical protein